MVGKDRVEELNSEEENSDDRGVGLSARRQTRFVSDSLNFTGTDLGDRSGGVVRRGHRYEESDDEEDSEESSESGSEDEEDTEGSNSGSSSQQSPQAREEALIQSALKRINRAQAQGRADVKLNKEELAALERRRKRLQEEAERAERERAARASGGSGSDRKRRKEQRVAIPLSQFEPISRKKRSSAHPPRQDSLPSRVSSAAGGDSPDGHRNPPMGYFAPPSQSRSRSSSTLQRPGSRARDTNVNSPPVAFNQHSSQHAASYRQTPDSTSRPHSRGLPHQDGWTPNSSLEPFQYQTEGPRHAYPTNGYPPNAYPANVYPPSVYPTNAITPSRRHAPSPSEMAYMQQSHASSSPMTRSRQASARQSMSRVGDSETSEEDTTSDELGNGAQIREPARGRDREIVVEVSPEPEPEPEPVKKKSSSPTKRKSAPNGGRKKRK